MCSEGLEVETTVITKPVHNGHDLGSLHRRRSPMLHREIECVYPWSKPIVYLSERKLAGLLLTHPWPYKNLES